VSDQRRRERISIGIAELAAVMAVVILAIAAVQSALKHHDTQDQEQARAAAERARQADDARRFTAIIASCLNGEGITVGERIVDCKVRK